MRSDLDRIEIVCRIERNPADDLSGQVATRSSWLSRRNGTWLPFPTPIYAQPCPLAKDGSQA